jgi:hypothetical protein
MASKSGETPDAILKKLRRLDSNMVCPNCGTPGQRGIGFGNVCVKFSTFVCDLCKLGTQLRRVSSSGDTFLLFSSYYRQNFSPGHFPSSEEYHYE